MKIFVSYTLRDRVLDVDALQEIESIFLKIGEPYIDILHNKSANPQDHVINMLGSSEVFCSLVTPGYFQSDWVQIELDIAIKMRIPMVEVVLPINKALCLPVGMKIAAELEAIIAQIVG
jgi:hypothetical protein